MPNPLSDPEFWGRDVLSHAAQAAQGLTAGALGAPVDIAAAFLNPLVGAHEPVGGSAWIARMLGGDQNSLAFQAGLLGPTPDTADLMRLAPAAVGAVRRAASSIPWDRSTIGSGSPMPDELTVVDVDPRKVSAAVRGNAFVPESQAKLHELASGPYGAGDTLAAQQMLSRQQRLREWIGQGKTVSLPEMTVSRAGVDFVNGRNRFILARDSGERSVPVAVDKSEIPELKRRGLLAD